MDHQTIPEYGEFPIPISIYWINRFSKDIWI
jgi:hypothetical protein